MESLFAVGSDTLAGVRVMMIICTIIPKVLAAIMILTVMIMAIMIIAVLIIWELSGEALLG